MLHFTCELMKQFYYIESQSRKLNQVRLIQIFKRNPLRLSSKLSLILGRLPEILEAVLVKRF